MLKKATILHLRIPFSLFLLPFFCFAVSQASSIQLVPALVAFFLIHLLFYPASNGFNSYFDKDEESIGGLKHPPKVSKELYHTSLLMDFIALIMALTINIDFFIMLLIIGLASKAYSHPVIRLKKYPFLGLMTVAFFQGGYTYLMSLVAVVDQPFTSVLSPKHLSAAGLCSLLLFGSYPMTQVYQHGEDGRRGDQTISRILGVKGTFVWTAMIFTVAIIGFFVFFKTYYSLVAFYFLLITLAPTLIFFLLWFKKVLEDDSNADFESTMMLNKLSSYGFIFFFSLLTYFNAKGITF